MKQAADTKKAQMWRSRIHDAARSGLSIREFCRRRKVNESQFYWWQRRLKEKRPATMNGSSTASRASFALVSDEAGALEAGLELVLGDGRRLRIARGVDEATLRAVLAAVEAPGC